ncbi:autotransporter outer membrane beta-barrel domain-containing protein [Bradyrhizobium brasilense]|uniref:autotransporter outer membrane beta-barrel domain-containing protein n=1 Tax=Bradyrhizobium brasilense TaxID=1419277 RepID=UPI001E57F2B1|nr:autotransporter domain-containing protein [Bradyrhizobium brasilense]MCC8971935.1 autotransporter domain-containing protein [Bradyrhizobium brasilense]
MSLALSLMATAASAQNFSRSYFFGDSLTDTGWFLYKPLGGAGFGLAGPGAGTWTTNPDPGWAQIFASKFGGAATPSDTPGVGGNNYAIGGARVVAQGGNVLSTQTQIATYLASTGGIADPNAIYTYWAGSNDLKTTTVANGASPGNIVNPQNVPQLLAVAAQAASQVTQLWNAGARYIVVPNTPALNAAAAAASARPYDPVLVQSRSIYDQALWNNLAAAGVRVIPGDIASIYNYVLANPAPFGITVTSALTPACGNVNSYQCTPANYVAPNANKTHFWADGPGAPDGGGHATGAVQQIVADYLYSLVVAPSEISFLAEAPLKTRFAVINSIQNQIPLSFGQAGTFRGWASGDLSRLKMTSGVNGFPNDPGTPAAVTGGFDYSITSNWLVGAAFSGQATKQTFSLGGDYRQEEFAVSLYTAYRHDALWIDAIGSWGTLRDTVNRQIPLGTTTQSNLGSTRGSNISFAGEIGYDFGAPSAPPAKTGVSYKAPVAPVASFLLTHGPVAGVILQQVYVDGFTETNPSGAPTALSFGSQTRNSAVTEFGYRASVKFGIWEPYAKLTWDHEFADLNRLVTASLTSIVAPSFSMPGVILGRDWAAATIGTRFRLANNISGYAALTGQLGQNNATTYGGQIGLNVAFDPTGTVVAKY